MGCRLAHVLFCGDGLLVAVLSASSSLLRLAVATGMKFFRKGLLMKSKTRRLVNSCAATALSLLLFGQGHLSAQTYTFDVVSDTILLNNGAAQSEQNYGGRTELFGAKNGGAPRDILLRFDVSQAAAEIMNSGLAVLDATLILNPRDERTSANQSAIHTELGVFGLRSENEGWVEGTAIGAGAGLQGQLGSVSRLYLSTPSSATPGGGPADDGLQWFSAGGGPTTETIPTQFNVSLDTTNVLLGSASTTGVDTSGADADFVIPLNGELLNPFMSQWIAAPQMDDGKGGMVSSNAGLVITQITPGNSSQWFFESIEGNRPDQVARLSVTFGPAPVPGDVNDSGFANELDFEIIRQNFWQSFSERGEGDLINNDFIDFADYGQWKQAAKAPDPGALTGTAVPEPSTALLGFAATLLGVGCWRRSK